MGKEFSSLICVYAAPGVTVRKCLQLEPFSFSVFLANIQFTSTKQLLWLECNFINLEYLSIILSINTFRDQNIIL